MKTISGLMILIICAAYTVHADDVQALLVAAQNHYSQRENSEELESAISTLEKALQTDPSSFEAAWSLAKAYWYKGNFSSSEKKPAFEKGIEAGKKAAAIAPEKCEGHFWLGINYALLAENSGAFGALGLVDDIKREINRAMEIDQNCVCGGPSRVLGKLYAELPWFKGGSKTKAVSYLKQSLDLCPRDTQSRIFLAEIYQKDGEKAEAIELLKQVEMIEPTHEWIPETKANKISAEKMLREIQKSNGKD